MTSENHQNGGFCTAMSRREGSWSCNLLEELTSGGLSARPARLEGYLVNWRRDCFLAAAECCNSVKRCCRMGGPQGTGHVHTAQNYSSAKGG